MLGDHSYPLFMHYLCIMNFFFQNAGTFEDMQGVSSSYTKTRADSSKSLSAGGLYNIAFSILLDPNLHKEVLIEKLRDVWACCLLLVQHPVSSNLCILYIATLLNGWSDCVTWVIAGHCTPSAWINAFL